MTSSFEPTAEPASRLTSLVELLRLRASTAPERTAYRFLSDGETEDTLITYRELERRAQAIAAHLQEAGAAGERALLVYPAGLDYVAAFFGCLYAGAIGVPAVPPRLNRNAQRLQAMATDAGAAFALTNASLLPRLGRTDDESNALARLRWIATDTVSDSQAAEWREPALSGERLAYLQYTSGSTSTPKGVMITHANLLHNSADIQRGFAHTPESVALTWLPHFHDMGLVDGIIQPLYSGFPGLLMSPASFLQRPLRWLEAVARHRVTHTGGPNFAYDLCVRRTNAEQRAALDLSSWRVAYNGAEPVRHETLRRFADAFAASGFRSSAFYPAYGLAEATLKVTGGSSVDEAAVCVVEAAALERHLVSERRAGEEGARTLVSSGRAEFATEVVIVNPERLEVCAPDEVGEIWVSGAGVAAGYWNRAEETERTFHARLAGDVDAATYLRTGDLGFLRRGELYVTGRLKDLIIIRGRNLYPQDIEEAVERCHTALRAGGSAAFSVEVGREERLVVVQELERRQEEADAESIIAAIRETLAEDFEAQPFAVLLLRAGSVPKTSSGKVRHGECRARFLSSDFAAIAEWRASVGAEAATEASDTFAEPPSVGTIQSWLRSQLAAKLGVDAASIEVNHPLTSYGVDSLMATELTHAVETRLGVVLSLGDLLASPSLAEIAESILERGAATNHASRTTTPSPQTGEMQSYPLSHGQQALWFLHQLAPESTAYHLAVALKIGSEVDSPALVSVFQMLVDRHPSLRTTFEASTDGVPAQVVHERMEVSFGLEDAAPWNEETLRERLSAESQRPFDLERGPLFRVVLFGRAREEYVLLVVAHHLVVDLWSLAVLIDELGALYAAETRDADVKLAPPAADYGAYVRRQRELLNGEDGTRLAAFWQRQLSGELPTLNLRTDRTRPPVQTYNGASQSLRLDARLAEQLKRLSREQDATLFMLLLAAFDVLLYRYTGQEDLLVGSPTAGRPSAQFAQTVGYFVNPLVLRAHPSGELRFDKFLRQVRRNVLEAFAHQDYPFDLLVKQVQTERDPSRSPLFQVMFAFNKAHLLHDAGLSALALGEEGARMNLNGLALETFKLEQRIAQFDLSLTTAEAGDELLAAIEYNIELFDASTVRRMLGHFRTLLESIVSHPSQTLAQLPLLDPNERDLLLGEWSGSTPRTSSATEHERAPVFVQRLFEQQAAERPERTSVVFQDERLTYRELNARANQLAHYLRRFGVGADVPVGICLARSTRMVVALLGVLKAGGAYVPLDSKYPPERLAFILEDTRAPVLLTEQRLVPDLPSGDARVIRLDADWEEIARESADNPTAATDPHHLAYIIYTSGSTGRPKGVMISHGSLAAASLGWAKGYDLAAPRNVLQMANFTFDVFTEDVCRALLNGGKLVLTSQDELFSPQALYELMRRERVDFADFVPAILRALVQHLDETGHRLDFMRAVVSGADVLYVEDYRKLRHVCGDRTRLINSYGVTEATIDNTIYESSVELISESIVPIGRPFAGLQTYLLDAHMQPVPIGVSGELYLGGMGLARGYLKRPDLTAEKFVPDPFSGACGARLYRTGDLARFLPDGNIAFIGRNDFQLKIRGHRIESGEIEAALVAHAQVREAVVVSVGEGQEKRVVAYVVADKTALAAKQLRSFLRERLSEHILPSEFVFLDTLPLTHNGKPDRRALPAPNQSPQETPHDYAPPQTTTERALARIWAELLKLERVGADDNFFELGGDSILSIQVIARARQAGIMLTPRQIFEHPTIAALAQVHEANSTARDAHGDGDASAVAPATKSADDTAVDFPLAGLDRQKTVELLRAHGAVQDIYPLSPMQQGMLFHSLYAPDTSIYTGQFSSVLRGQLDEAAFVAALEQLFERHEILRTFFVWENLDEPLQLVRRNLGPTLERHDWRGLSPQESTVRWESLLAQERQRSFHLQTPPLIRMTLARTGEDAYRFAWTHHHLLLDGWSGALLLRELFDAYEALRSGAATPTPRVGQRPRFRDFIEWLKLQDIGKAEAFWRDKLKGFDAPTPLVVDRMSDAAEGDMPDGERGEHSLNFSAQATARLQAAARRHHLTLNTLVQGAWALLLSRYSDEETVLFGATVAGRPPALGGVDSIVGLFINTLPVRVRVPEEMSLAEWLKLLQTEQAASREYEYSPLADVQRWSEVARGQALFESLLVFENYPVESVALSEGVGLKLGDVRSFDHTNYPLTIIAMPGEKLLLQALYDRRRFDDDAVERLLGHLQVILESIAADPLQTVAAVEVLTERERRQLLLEWNDTRRDYAADLCMHELFEAQVRRTPERIALVDEQEELTYAELNRRANRLAHYLKKLGVGAEVRVGVCVERSARMMVALFGVQKAGGAYVGLDPAYPQERIAYMLEDCGARVLLTEQHLVAALPASDAQVVCLDTDWPHISAESADDAASGATPRNLAYVIYTSGSTGKPKGTAIEHRSAVVFSEWARASFDPEAFRGTLGFSSICFDLSIFELFVPLHWGGKVVLVKGILQISQLPAAHPVTLINTVPSAINELLELGYLPPSAHTVNLAGEALSARVVKKLYASESVRHVFNLYGPTEDTTYSTWDSVRRDADESPTIGRPIGNTQVYLLDRSGRPVPVGVAGELYLGGMGLARGYLKRPDLTAEKFVPDPFCAEGGARLYRTGDLARFLPDGRIDYLGRLDHQVKVLGHRIELGEIEAALVAHPSIGNCVVVAREDVAGDKRLVAYVVPADGHQPAHAELRHFLKERLLQQMLPSAFVILEELPLTPNGKIDRKALPAPETTRPEVEQRYVAPRDAIEEALAALWQELLGLERVGVHDNFFDLGGHSLLATRLLSRVRGLFRTELSLQVVFESATVEQLALAVVAGEAKPGQTERIARAWRKVRNISAQELKGELERKRREKSIV